MCPTVHTHTFNGELHCVHLSFHVGRHSSNGQLIIMYLLYIEFYSLLGDSSALSRILHRILPNSHRYFPISAERSTYFTKIILRNSPENRSISLKNSSSIFIHFDEWMKFNHKKTRSRTIKKNVRFWPSHFLCHNNYNEKNWNNSHLLDDMKLCTIVFYLK